MPTDGEQLLETYLALDRALVAAGWHATSPAWLDTLQTFWLSGKTRLVIRKGRQAGGSKTLERVSVATALCPSLALPKGTRGEFGFLSHKLREANERLYGVDQVLTAIGEPHTWSGDTLELKRRPVIFRSSPCTSRERGQTRISLVEDEMTSWWSDDLAANPAEEVDAAAMPSLITQSNARAYSNSTPRGDDDFHAKLFARGDTDSQMVVQGPSWFWNPTIDEAQTHRLQPDMRLWTREFAGKPTATVVDAYLADVVRGCVDVGRVGMRGILGHAYVISLDPAFRADEFACSVMHGERGESGITRVVVDEVLGWRAEKGKVLSVEWVCDRVADVCHRYRTMHVVSDQKDQDTLGVLFDRLGIHFRGIPWTAANKANKFRAFRALCMDRRVSLPDEPVAIAQLEAICMRETANGNETFEGARGKSDDRAFAIVLGATEVANGLRVSTAVAPPVVVRDFGDASGLAGLGSAAIDHVSVWGTSGGSGSEYGRGVQLDENAYEIGRNHDPIAKFIAQRNRR